MGERIRSFLCQILDPGAGADQNVAGNAFNKVCGIAQEVDHQNGEICPLAQAEAGGYDLCLLFGGDPLRLAAAAGEQHRQHLYLFPILRKGGAL